MGGRRRVPAAFVALAAWVALAWVALVVAGCGVAGSSPAPRGLTVYAAASLTSAMDRVRSAYEAANPGLRLTVSIGASSSLETQIEQGAPADVLLSADLETADRLGRAGLAAGDVVAFAANALTIVVPAGNPAGVASPADLARPGLKIVAAGDAVPVSRYASQLVANLAAASGDPAGFEAAYAANIVSREDDVAAVVSQVALGEADAAIVYETDARSAARLETIAVPPALNVQATYGGVAVRGSSNPDGATAFLAWLTGPDGQAILDGLGFRAPG
jgi:molybdate transport system substrate-binding protein